MRGLSERYSIALFHKEDVISILLYLLTAMCARQARKMIRCCSTDVEIGPGRLAGEFLTTRPHVDHPIHIDFSRRSLDPSVGRTKGPTCLANQGSAKGSHKKNFTVLWVDAAKIVAVNENDSGALQGCAYVVLLTALFWRMQIPHDISRR